MLSELKIAETIEIPYSGIAPAQPVQRFNLQQNTAYKLASIRSTITAAAAIVLPGATIRDENGSFIFPVPIIPWQFAATTVTTTISQAPDVPITALFGPALGGFIASDLHVFDGWTIQFTDFLGTPGVVFDATIVLTRAWQR